MRQAIRVRFDGVDLWWLINDDGSGPLAPLDHCDDEGNVIVLAESYAHVFADGTIKRYGRHIGKADDIELVSEAA